MAVVPSGFKPSCMSRAVHYDEEGRLREFNISRPSTGGIGDANSLYATDAEHFDQVAPFLKQSILNDRTRRNYMVQPGGAILFNPRESPAKALFPSNRESMGHDKLGEAQIPTALGGSPFRVSDKTNGVE